MTYEQRQKLRIALERIRATERLCNEALNATQNAATEIEAILQNALDTSIANHVTPDMAPTDHRRAHRMGRPSKIDTDPELRAFLLARIDRLTFDEMARAVETNFDKARKVSKSSIHRWWARQ